MMRRFSARTVLPLWQHRALSATAACLALPKKAAAPSTLDVLRRTRNIGIVAHIDAGKTTTTERMLFYAGKQDRIGEVDSGTTTTDYMEEEMERGITITAAAVTFPWRDATVNLIDTPGHIDFAIEVQRSLRVLDGVVALFDASAGVQAQSHTVLKMARSSQAPVMAFLNKMDKPNADFAASVQSIRDKLGMLPLVLHLPLHDDRGEFHGAVDLCSMCTLRYSGKRGDTVLRTPVGDEPAFIQEMARDGRRQLLDDLTSHDDELAAAAIEALDAHDGDEAAAEAAVPERAILDALRRVTLSSASAAPSEARLIPVMCGASRRDLGVQPLLDAVLELLPSPLDRPAITGLDADGCVTAAPHALDIQAVAFVFKVTHAPNPKKKGAHAPLLFFRVYSGKVAVGARLNNQRTGKPVTIEDLYVMHADRMIPVKELPAGSIGAAFVFECGTGDTLVQSRQALYRNRRELAEADARAKEQAARQAALPVDRATGGGEFHSFETIQAPPPVLSHAIEAASSFDHEPLREALERLCAEDPTLRTKENDRGQLVVSGMGELHLEIILSRLKREYELPVTLVKAIIEYCEGVEAEAVVVDGVGRAGDSVLFSADVAVVPRTYDDPLLGSDPAADALEPCTAVLSEECAARLRERVIAEMAGVSEAEKVKAANAEVRLVEGAFLKAAKQAGNMGPLTLKTVGIEFQLRRIAVMDPSATAKGYEEAFLRLLPALLRQVRHPTVFEPMMDVEVHVTEAQYLGPVMKSLNDRGATSVEVQDDNSSVRAVVPLRNIVRYASEVRKAAKGNVYFWTTLRCYRQVSNEQLRERIVAGARKGN